MERRIAESENFNPKIKSFEIYNNDILINTQQANFYHDQNKLEFKIYSPSLRYKEDINYKYKLTGIDKEWAKAPYEQNFFTYKSLPPGQYRFDLFLLFRGDITDQFSYEFRITAPYWKSWWFTLCLILAALTLVMLIYLIQIKRQRKLHRLREEIITSKLKAIQSQMNPHFIFNSINSIQDLILQKQTLKSYDYLVNFSNLVRSVLKFTERDLIQLKEEKQFLLTYLTLEKLRFKEEFEYEVQIDQQIDHYYIPSLIIQPLAENAIKHGLLHKKGKKKLHIKIAVENSVLICEVIDNGIGIERSRTIKRNHIEKHASFSTIAIKNRLELLSSKTNQKTSFGRLELKEEGIILGTKVILKLPLLKEKNALG